MTTSREPPARRGLDGASGDAPNASDSRDELDESQPLGQESEEIVEQGARIGTRRLDRPAIGDAVTSLIGGLNFSFGAVAFAWAAAAMGGQPAPSPAHLVGSLAFPIGLIVVLVGKSELFTENFFLPVSSVLDGRGTMRQLLSLWGRSLVFNLVGCVLFAFLISRPGVLDEAVIRVALDVAAGKLDQSASTVFFKAIIAGWLMTLLTWLMLAARGLGPRLIIIWIIGTLLALGQFNHVVISGAQVSLALLLGAEIPLFDSLIRNFLPTLVGNVAGGVVMVTLLSRVQSQFEHE